MVTTSTSDKSQVAKADAEKGNAKGGRASRTPKPPVESSSKDDEQNANAEANAKAQAAEAEAKKRKRNRTNEEHIADLEAELKRRRALAKPECRPFIKMLDAMQAAHASAVENGNDDMRDAILACGEHLSPIADEMCVGVIFETHKPDADAGPED